MTGGHQAGGTYIYNSRNYIVRIDYINYEDKQHIYNSRNYIVRIDPIICKNTTNSLKHNILSERNRNKIYPPTPLCFSYSIEYQKEISIVKDCRD